MTNPFGAARETPHYATAAESERIAAFLRGVYWWMCLGLAVTALVALLVAGSPALVTALVSNRLLFWGLLLAELGIVIYLSARVGSLAPGTAAALFLGYAALNGVTFSIILLAFTGTSVATTFLITAGMFGSMALYGTVTGRNLTGMGQFMLMGLVGLILAGIVSLFWQNDAVQFVMGVVGVLVFSGLAAYDAQRLKAMALQTDGGPSSSVAIVGALRLYLDFVNLFLSLLRLFGRRR
jgi:uncharacterized protein